jgi:UDP-glucose 4-epimerase|tara:strand:+ start:1108 stop:2001 length:894 start_codon:yes stop_codon:yes gene_type:complete
MNVLVTGGAGFIGANLIKRLIGDGHQVVSLDNYTTGTEKNNIEDENVKYFYTDIRDVLDFNGFSEKPFDIVYHLAAVPRIQPSFEYPEATFEVNVNGTLNLLSWLRTQNIPIVYAGSSSSNGDIFKNPYTFSKFQGEEIVRLYHKIYKVPMGICRFYNVYGPHQVTEGEYCTVMGIFETQFNEGKELTITGDGEQRRDFTHVFDIVDGFVRCGDLLLEGRDNVNGETFELGRGENHSINVIAQSFDTGYTYIPERPGEMRETLCTDTKARDLLGWKPTIDVLDYIEGVRVLNEIKTN